MTDHGLTRIGKYEIVDVVGEGAMGIVYRAVDTVLQRTVAVKVMSDAIARRGDLRDRFLREAQAAGSLQHPNLITIYDFGEVEGHLFIAMEFVDGMDLEGVIARSDPLPLAAKLDVMIDVLTGLAYAHKRGIVHRDIKPANVRVTTDGRAKIMDFGIAHLTSSDLTRTGVAMGTPAYMAPEQALGGKVTAATDIFAVGAVLYELLAGVKAFEGPTLHNVLYKIISEEPKDVRELVPELPPELARILAKSLAKDVDGRYGSALDMAGDLTAVRDSLGGVTYSGTLSLRASIASAAAEQQRQARGARRRRTIALAAVGLTAAGVAAMWEWSWRRPAPAPHLAASAVGTAGRPRPESAPAPAVRADTAAASLGSSLGAARSTPAPPVRPAAATSGTDGRRRAPERRAPAAVPVDARPAGDAESAVEPSPGRRSTSPPSAAPPPTAPPATVGPLAPDSDRVAGSHDGAPAADPPAPAPAPAPPPSAPLATPSAADVPRAIAAYAHAIESRDLDSVRRIYPGLSATQERGFGQFFRSTRSVRVTFSVTGLEVSGSSAQAHLEGTYEYVTEGGKTERQPVSFQATLGYDGGEWRLLTVR